MAALGKWGGSGLKIPNLDCPQNWCGLFNWATPTPILLLTTSFFSLWFSVSLSMSDLRGPFGGI